MEKFAGKSPKLRKLLEGGAKGGGLGSLKGFTGGKKTLFKSKDFPKIMSKMKVKQMPPLITKAEVRKATLKVKANIEKQKKVPGYVQTKASKKVTDKFITREQKISLNAPFKTVGEQAKVINQIKSNVQVRQLNRTLRSTKKDKTFKLKKILNKTPLATKETNFQANNKMTVPNPGAHYSRYNAYDHMSPNWDKKSNTLKLKKVKTGNILKESNIKEYAGDVKNYVKQRNAYGWKQAQKEADKPTPSGYGSKKNPTKKERELEKRFQQHKLRMKKKPKT